MRKDGKEDRKQAPLSSSFLPWRSLSSSFSNLTSAAREGEMGVLSNKIEREQLKPGDHIYSWRSAYIYAHHGASSSSSSSSTNSLVTSPLLALSIGGRSCNRLCYSYCCSCCYSWLLSQSRHRQVNSFRCKKAPKLSKHYALMRCKDVFFTNCGANQP